MGNACINCANYRHLVNQGIWWCGLGHDLDADNCSNYDVIETEITQASTNTQENDSQNDVISSYIIGTLNQ